MQHTISVSFIYQTVFKVMVHEIEDFYGVYLLLSQNPRYKGRTYIGYTVDPNRRIKQHNTGSHAGGAWRTSGRGPWEMVLIIHGFPNDISALRFEWAWQHPDKCRRLKHVPVSKKKSETAFQHRWRIVCHMLYTPPWSRLALNVRWLKQDFKLDFPAGLVPPTHMPVVFGPVRSKKIAGQKISPKKSKGNRKNAGKSNCLETQAVNKETDAMGSSTASSSTLPTFRVCILCHQRIMNDAELLTCFWPHCAMCSHIACLAQWFLSNDPGHLIPVEGSCPGCKKSVLWGDIIRHYRGCYQDLATNNEEDVNSQDSDSDHWTNLLST